jgi:hypothetical protein
VPPGRTQPFYREKLVFYLIHTFIIGGSAGLLTEAQHRCNIYIY